MSRGLTTVAASAVAAETPLRTVAIELDFPSGFTRVNGSPSDLTLNGQVYIGIGGLGAISAVEESSELRAYDLTLQLSGVPRDAVALALAEAYQGRRGTVWEVLLDPVTYAPLLDPIVVFRGRMDQMTVTLGDTATVKVTLLNRLADWERPRVRRYTDEDQKRIYPFDDGFKFVAATTEKPIIWPANSWQPGHSGGGEQPPDLSAVIKAIIR